MRRSSRWNIFMILQNLFTKIAKTPARAAATLEGKPTAATPQIISTIKGVADDLEKESGLLIEGQPTKLKFSFSF